MTTLCLTGWQQPADTLSYVAPGAEHFDYAAYDDVETMFAALPKAPRLAIGWSLGGQLLVRAIAAGHTKPQMLILLAAPFQWLADERFPQGFPAASAAEVKHNYRLEPQAMLKNLNALIALGDTHERFIARSLNASLRVWRHGMRWLNEFSRASCANLSLEAFPPVLIIHGLKDSVIRYPNAQAFSSRLPQTELLLWPACAHAPHLHDPEAVKDIIAEYV